MARTINYDPPTDDGSGLLDEPEVERPDEPTCPRCGAEIDPTSCHCGDAIDGREHDNHYPVPMGCRCHEMSMHDLVAACAPIGEV